MTDPVHNIELEQHHATTFSFAGAKLAPSEAVLLYGDSFSPSLPPAVFGREKLLRTDCNVSSGELSRAIWMAALLSLEAMGCIRFEVHRKVSLLPGPQKALYVAPLPSSNNLPLRCLERRICRTLSQGICRTDSLVYRLLEQEGWHSRFNTLRLVKDGLLERGLVTIRVSKRFGPPRFAD